MCGKARFDNEVVNEVGFARLINALSKKLRNLKAADATTAGITDRVCRRKEFVMVSPFVTRPNGLAGREGGNRGFVSSSISFAQSR